MYLLLIEFQHSFIGEIKNICNPDGAPAKTVSSWKDKLGNYTYRCLISKECMQHASLIWRGVMSKIKEPGLSSWSSGCEYAFQWRWHRFDPTSYGATKPMHHNDWASVLQTTERTHSGTCTPQLERRPHAIMKNPTARIQCAETKIRGIQKLKKKKKWMKEAKSPPRDFHQLGFCYILLKQSLKLPILRRLFWLFVFSGGYVKSIYKIDV